ncbi:hypothetical protein O181_001194 [Austropuccinia psidii MF-1]|uniref:Uncharacterized protein n=1 Tax=Austropuccinia psidii MF-1 TaxID=1389203 RepID=A0A9Q3BA14_9BASI|nr:hypothetical protein [Austropuccinia psidii MF-1]
MMVSFDQKQNIATQNVYDTKLTTDGEDHYAHFEGMDSGGADDKSPHGIEKNYDYSRRHTQAPCGSNSSNQCKHALTSNDFDRNSDHMHKNVGINTEICASQTQDFLKMKDEKKTPPSDGRILDQFVTKPKHLVPRIVGNKMERTIRRCAVISNRTMTIMLNYQRWSRWN